MLPFATCPSHPHYEERPPFLFRIPQGSYCFSESGLQRLSGQESTVTRRSQQRGSTKMVETYHPEAIMDAIVAAQIEATTVPLREDDDDTIHGAAEAKVTNRAATFEFSDFDLDLSCLSTAVPPASPSPPPSPILSRSISFAKHLAPLSGQKQMKRQSSPLLAPNTTTSIIQGTWPSPEYTGRGTPIDRNRRVEWGGTTNDEVGEDGILFSAVRSTSLDSAIRPRRSMSPEWQYLSPIPSSKSPSPPGSDRRYSLRRSIGEKVPDLTPIEIKGIDPDQPEDWASMMQAVLGSAEGASTSNLEAKPVEKVEEKAAAREVTEEALITSPSALIEEPNDLELDMDLGIGEALNKGLGLHGPGMTFFDLGILPNTGRESPSVYSSQTASARISRPSSPSERKSMTSSKEAERSGKSETKSSKPGLLKRVLGRFRRLPDALHHKNRS
ncbi:hypothetical protein BDQ12DRAFT_375247 [Crucibulum laeve]|uniref:Uncharacterized protein n=1 Tax=Crucibulum laeve TaxID=68775 RepID=A0A5C3LMA1_9AGAR|nr:hypothetical protein BDQ12DRAFT_375247 [Crucibulum laeve]